MPARQECVFVDANWLADIVMNVAVADMAERNGAHAWNEFCHRGVRQFKKLRHCSDRHRYVVLDRPALRLLHLGQHLPNAPESLRLVEALGDGRVLDKIAL